MLAATMGTLVTYNPKAVAPESTLGELQQLMQQLQVRHIPVIDSEHHVVGLVSERDLARAKYNAAVTAVDGSLENIDNKRVEEIMARNILTMDQNEPPEVALRSMVAHSFHSVPVTDDSRLLGMITSSDFLRECSYGEWPESEQMVRLRMSPPGQTVDAEVSLAQVLETAEKCNQEFVVVVRRHRPLGILSRTALRQCLYDAHRQETMATLHTTPVRLLLSTLPSLLAEMPLGRAADRMLECRARALPVVDKARMLLGVLQEDDILRAMVEQLSVSL
jgi:CBS domain-containing membrane protein